MDENKCGCKPRHDCQAAARLWERVKELYEDARHAGLADRFFGRYLAAHSEYREHREKALGYETFKDIIKA